MAVLVRKNAIQAVAWISHSNICGYMPADLSAHKEGLTAATKRCNSSWELTNADLQEKIQRQLLSVAAWQQICTMTMRSQAE